MARNSNQPATSLEDILVTDELSRRPAPAANLAEEVDALHAIAGELARNPRATLDALIEAAVTLCHAGSAGVSLLEKSEQGPPIFRWVAMAGEYAPYLGHTTPRDFSPCGTTLDCGTPQLFHRPARYFTYFKEAEPPELVEGLVVPFRSGEIEGTIWVAAHDEQRQFTSEDARILSSLGDCTAVALRAQMTRGRLEEA